MDRRGRWTRASVASLVVPLCALCALGTPWRYAAVTAANLVPLVVLGVQMRRDRRTTRTAWLLLLLGTGTLALHNAQNQAALATTGVLAVGVLPAATLALGYVLLLVGGTLATTGLVRRDPGGMLDAAIIGLAAACLMWGAVLSPAHQRLGSSMTRTVYELSLVLVVTALTGVIARTAIVSREVRVPALYLLGAVLAADASDVTLTLTENPASGLSAWWASLPCIVALVAFAVALLYPSVLATPSVERSSGRITLSRVVFLGGALTVGPALAVVRQVLGGPVDVTLLSLGALFMVPLVGARIGMLAHGQARAERRLEELASLDELTGLPNRRALTERLDRLLERVAAGESPGAAVLYMDLDEFKAVNDTHGHLTGDRLLRTVGARLLARVRPGDLVARFGGDEFVLVLEGDPETVGHATAAAVDRALAEPIAIGAVVTSGRASIGVATAAPGMRTDAEALLQLADAQMYLNKRSRQQADTWPPDIPLPWS
ncbi:MAG TPA: GGDEF domain-containing protein [Cellulomonas sp.]